MVPLAGKVTTTNTSSYFLERCGRIFVVVANYQDYANGDVRRVLCPDVLVELLALAPATAFSRSNLLTTLRDLIINHFNFQSQAEITRAFLISLEKWCPALLEIFAFSLPDICTRSHITDLATSVPRPNIDSLSTFGHSAFSRISPPTSPCCI